MTRGAWTCWQQDDGFQIWLEPRENEKPFTDSERAQRWRLSLASLLFLTILLSDHLWFCAEAKLTRTRDKFSANKETGAYPSGRPAPPRPRSAHSSLRGSEDAIFIGNSTKHLLRLETCPQDSFSKDCVTFGDADHLCKGLSEADGGSSPVNMSDLYLSFCNSYSLLDLFYGSTSADQLNCSPDALSDGDLTRCSLCIQAYQRYDQHAQEKYEDFELMTQKYETDAYSVRTCMEQCKVAYKPWLCAQYFPTTQGSCARRVPCHQYCLEVQQSCPFILPDNDDLIHGGSPSFICTGLLGERPSTPERDAECCDVRWDAQTDRPSGGTLKKRTAPCQPPPGATAGASAAAAGDRLCHGRQLKICLLALVLLHTAIAMSVSDCTSWGAWSAAAPEETAPSEE
uniref:NALCN channel auxiliary factor 1a n=1 Tax=Gadus morhua TaxID=8049 RepID=A0A8C5A2D8_GADMO